MPKPKYPIPGNQFPRFFDEYLMGQSGSMNELARKINELVPEELAVPIDMLETKSGNSNVFGWKNGVRPKEPVIREALCSIFHIDYVESLFLISSQATDYLLEVFDYLSKFIEEFELREPDISVNQFNVGQLINESVKARNYLNLSYLIKLIIRTEEDRNEFLKITFYDDKYLVNYHQKPWSFFDYSKANIYTANEKNNAYRFQSNFMLKRLSNSFKILKPDLESINVINSEWSDRNIYNYFKISLLNDTHDENISCLNVAINLLINIVSVLDKFYLNQLNILGINESKTVYKMTMPILLENNDFLNHRK